jgi:citrate lyase gamma subunit|tara:strand:+ start:38 stop:301 length:264 start_codon:yes stop_codon:yes gene_type:complete
MSEVNTKVTDLVDYWVSVSTDNLLDLEIKMPSEVYKQLNSYIQELHDVNEEIDISGVQGAVEDAQYSLESALSELQTALSEIDYLER